MYKVHGLSSHHFIFVHKKTGERLRISNIDTTTSLHWIGWNSIRFSTFGANNAARYLIK